MYGKEAHKLEFHKDVELKTSISIEAVFALPPDSVYEKLKRSAVKINLEQISKELERVLNKALDKIIQEQNKNMAEAIAKNNKIFKAMGL